MDVSSQILALGEIVADLRRKERLRLSFRVFLDSQRQSGTTTALAIAASALLRDGRRPWILVANEDNTHDLLQRVPGLVPKDFIPISTLGARFSSEARPLLIETTALAELLRLL